MSEDMDENIRLMQAQVEAIQEHTRSILKWVKFIGIVIIVWTVLFLCGPLMIIIYQFQKQSLQY